METVVSATDREPSNNVDWRGPLEIVSSCSQCFRTAACPWLKFAIRHLTQFDSIFSRMELNSDTT